MLVFTVLLTSNVFGQYQYTLTIESSPALTPELTTYRFYVDMQDPTDRMSAVYGNDTFPLEVNAPDGVFNSAFNSSWNASGIIPAFIAVFPEMVDDTYATIGLDMAASESGIANAADPSLVQDPSQPISTFFDTDGATQLLSNTFTGSSWYVLNGSDNALPDANLRVLILQVTTSNTGGISGRLNVQLFPLGYGPNQINTIYLFDGEGTFYHYDGFIHGCMDPLACNFMPEAEVEEYCDYFSCLPIGCTDSTACNYDPLADFEDGTCEYALAGYNCDGSCFNDSDGDGICDVEEIAGCQDSEACNFNSLATDSDGSCVYAEVGYDCTGNCTLDENENGVCDFEEVYGCSIPTACNYNPATTVDDGSCEFVSCLVPGCVDIEACNFDAGAEIDDGSCEYPPTGYDCLGACLLDTDGDGVCDPFEVLGCTNSTALNFDPSATDDDGSCTYPPDPILPPEEFDFTPTPFAGTMLGNITLDGAACEEIDWVAAFDPDGNCAGSAPLFMDGGTAYIILTIYGDESLTTLIDEGLSDGDYFTLKLFDASTLNIYEYYEDTGVVEFQGWSNTNGAPMPGYANPNVNYDFLSIAYVPECLDPLACNFDPSSTSNLNCIYPDTGYDCDGICLNDFDNDGVCDEFEIEGCTDLSACNFDSLATNDDGTCATLDECGICGGTGIPDGNCDCAGNQLDALGVCGGTCLVDADADGICDDVDDCVGTLDECSVCNGPGAIYECGCSDIPAGDCDCNGNQLDALGVCGGSCVADADGDGICDDVDDCIGALDECGVCNGPGAIYECGCSDIPAGDCDCSGNQLDVLGVCGGSCQADADADGICDDVDECVGALDECGVCNGPGAVYECGCSDIPTGDCDCAGNQLDALGVCGGDCLNDTDGDGICDTDEIPGCTDLTACNFNPLATDEDGTCAVIDECGICGGLGIPEGDCDCNGNQLDALGICGGDCIEDLDLDGVCDVDEVLGCDDDTAINFNPEATENDGNCNYDTLGPETFTYTPTPTSGTLYGTIKVDGIMANGLDWIAAFDESGNCAGANSILMNGGVAYANLTIYGDDGTTNLIDEGMNVGDSFQLVLYDASEDVYITYLDDLGSDLLSGWENTYGAPIPAWNNPLYVFDFITSVPCPGDYNEDGQVQLTDLLDFLTAYGSSCTGCPQDSNNDGLVQLTDLLNFLGFYGNNCP